MKKKFNADILIIIIILILIVFMSFLNGGNQVVGQTGGLGNNCVVDEDCDSGYCNEEYLCTESEPSLQLPVEERISTVTIS